MKFGSHEPREAESSTGERFTIAFDNGYGASIIRSAYSYGGPQLWELAVINPEGKIDYETGITDDVLGWLNESDVASTLDRIAALTPEVIAAANTEAVRVKRETRIAELETELRELKADQSAEVSA